MSILTYLQVQGLIHLSNPALVLIVTNKNMEYIQLARNLYLRKIEIIN